MGYLLIFMFVIILLDSGVKVFRKQSNDRTRIARMTRIRTDGIIRENPFDPCHPCAFLEGDFCFQLGREKQTADEHG